jgi:hypothetical protein
MPDTLTYKLVHDIITKSMDARYLINADVPWDGKLDRATIVYTT